MRCQERRTATDGKFPATAVVPGRPSHFRGVHVSYYQYQPYQGVASSSYFLFPRVPYFVFYKTLNTSLANLHASPFSV